jgi:hypothetical protein
MTRNSRRIQRRARARWGCMSFCSVARSRGARPLFIGPVMSFGAALKRLYNADDIRGLMDGRYV